MATGLLIGSAQPQRVGKVELKNKITGEHAEIEFHRRSKIHAEGTFDGKIFDKDNKAVYEIFGSTYDSMSIKNIKTQEEE